MSKTKLYQGDNMLSLKKLPDNSIDSVVTDGPYGLSAAKNSGKTSTGGFMGKKWDYDVPSVEFWREVYRVLKPGGHVLSFGGTRTYHRMTVNIEDAGFEIRDCISWLYGSGFPKSHNIGKSVDQIRGNEREVDEAKTELYKRDSDYVFSGDDETRKDYKITKGTSEWEGWGTALKPSQEIIAVARKPLSEKTVAANVLKWGTGGINIDGCRVGFDMEDKNPATNPLYRHQNADKYKQVTDGGQRVGENVYFTNSMNPPSTEGRFPANIILDEEAGRVLDEQSGISGSLSTKKKTTRKRKYEAGGGSMMANREDIEGIDNYGDKGGASRFFYCPKVSKKERNAGCDELEGKETKVTNYHDFERLDGTYKATPVHKNTHPTVKPISLMAYLCRLVTPPNGIVLDTFMGSGSTGCAAVQEGFRFVGMEQDLDYFEIATKRINHYKNIKV